MLRKRGVALASALAMAGAMAPIGCASEREPVETIDGMTPAEYREKLEDGGSGPVGGTPAPAPASR